MKGSSSSPPLTEKQKDEQKMFVYLASSRPDAPLPPDNEDSDSDDGDEDRLKAKQKLPVSPPPLPPLSPSTPPQKTYVYIGRAHAPFERMQHHNREPGFNEGPKETRQGAPRWRPELILGPFDSGSHDIQKRWKKHTRGYRSRLLRGLTIGLHEQQRLGRQVIWYNDPSEALELPPRPTPPPSPTTTTSVKAPTG